MTYFVSSLQFWPAGSQAELYAHQEAELLRSSLHGVAS